MKISLNTKAIVLGRQDYREYDSLVSFYTLKYGRRLLLAKGTKKSTSKIVAHTEPFNLVDLMIILGKNRDYLGSAITQEAFLNIKNNINALYYVGLVFNWLNRTLRDNQSDNNIFLLLLDYLEGLDQLNEKEYNDKARQELLFAWFLFNFLKYLGYQVELNHCLHCQQPIVPSNNYFAFSLGGIICQHCYQVAQTTLNFTERQSMKTISNDAIKVARYLLTVNFLQINKLLTTKTLSHELFTLSQKFAEFYL